MAPRKNRLAGDKPRTLYAIVAYRRQWGRAPNAKELGLLLGISKEAASMRILRLRQDGVLIDRDGSVIVDSQNVVEQKETARFLIDISKICAGSDENKLHRDRLMIVARKRLGRKFPEKDLLRLINILVKGRYLAKVDRWPGYFTTGPRIADEKDYLLLLVQGKTLDKLDT